MKIQQLLAIALASASLVIASCSKEDHTAGQATGSGAQRPATGTGEVAGPIKQPPPATAGQPTGGEPQATGGGEHTGAPAAQPTTEAQQEVVGELKNLQTKIDALEQKASQASERQKASLVDQLNALKQQRERLKVKAQHAAASGVKVMNDLLTKVNESLDVLTRSVEPGATPSGAAAPTEGPK